MVGTRKRTVFLIVLTVIAAILGESESSVECGKSSALELQIEDQTFSVSNGFVCIEGAAGIITKVSADRSGQADYGTNTLKGGIHLVSEEEDGSSCSSGHTQANGDVVIDGKVEQDNIAIVTMKGITDCSGSVQEDWTLELRPETQGVSFKREGSASSAASPSGPVIRRQFDMNPSSITAWYDPRTEASTASVVQMKAAQPEAGYFASKIPLRRVYTLGGSGDEEGQVGNMSLDILFEEEEAPSTSVLVSRNDGGDQGWSGLQEVLLLGGRSPANPLQFYNHWTSGWRGIEMSTTTVDDGRQERQWSSTVQMFAHDLDYPVGTLGGSGTYDATKGRNLPDDDLHAFMTGIYASPVGCLCTHVSAVEEGVTVGQIATTIARPDRGYSGTYNYFDPDNYINTAALLWSGDRFLQEQVRMVVERSGSFLGGEGSVDPGQLPHHFEGTTPVFQALSGEVQTGPNIFWILTALNYAKSAGNFAWLRGYMPTLRLASNFLFNLLEVIPQPPSPSSPGEGSGSVETLASVPGSLMIDVFLRNNYTTDTNAMLVGFFREFAEAEEFLGNSTGAEQLRGLSDGVAKAMNHRLWCHSGDNATCSDGDSAADADAGTGAGAGDHFVTQWNGVASMDAATGLPTRASYRDFVDYDANLIAVAHGIPTDSADGLSGDGNKRAKRILGRIDGKTASGSGGQCRASSSFVSERYYGPDDCTDGNTGDSWCAMGRVGWFDALSRRVVGDVQSFDALLLEPLKTQLLSTTWMHERLNCDGSQMLNRTAMYFEYPSVTAMFVKSIRYGIDFGYGSVSVAPFMATSSSSSSRSTSTVAGPAGPSFAYDINGVGISFSPEAVRLRIHLEEGQEQSMRVSLSSLLPDTDYLVTTPEDGDIGEASHYTSDSLGQLDFTAATSQDHFLAVDCVALL